MPTEDSQVLKLRGWKEISRHLRADQRTARRWEGRGLPVHRLPGDSRSSVFAVPAELDQWLHRQSVGDGAVAAAAPPATARQPGPQRRRLLAVAAIAVPAAILLGVGWATTAKPIGALASVAVSSHADPQVATLVDQAKMQNARATANGFRQAIALSHQALARDPGSAPAYAELAFALIRLPENDATVDRQVAYEHAQQAAQRALDIDPGSWRAHSTMGFIEYAYHWNFVAGIRHFRDVIRLNPARGPGHNQLGIALLNMGDVNGALAELKLSAELESANPAYRAIYANAQYAAGDRSQAVATWRQILADDPNRIIVREFLRDDALARGDYREAISQGLEIARLRDDRDDLAMYRSAQRALAGGNVHAILSPMLAEAQSDRDHGGDRNFGVARIEALLGDTDAALAALKKALDAREPDVLAMRNDPLLASVRSDPRFERLATTYGISPAGLSH